MVFQLTEEILEKYEDEWLMELIVEHEMSDDKERISGDEVFKRCNLI